MQNYPDLKLQCCDCDEKFCSASRLLQHFAEHAKQGKTKNENRKKKRTKGEMESGSDSNQSQQTASTSSCESGELNSLKSCKLAKFDLQKRLESSVVTIKQELDSDSLVSCVKEEPPDDSNSSDSVNMSTDTKESEEYSPLKFCMITMEENSVTNDTSSPKKVASRKQLLPKKIERKVEGLRKLAPKAESKVASNEALLQSSQKKKYACHLCTKVFGWSTDLKRHILVHTGERPFKCDNCQATFTRNFLLQKHQSKVHPCKPKDPIVTKPELPKAKQEAEVDFHMIKEETAQSNDVDDDDDDQKLVITEETDEKPLTPSLSDSSWHLKSDRWCSKLKQPDIFGVAPVKVLST